MYVRYSLVSLLIVICFSAIAFVFWRAEYQYQIPTKIPTGYESVSTGQFVRLANRNQLTDSASVFLHFYNPDCPCSRFNVKHLRQLIHDYSAKTAIVMVVHSEADRRQAEAEFGNEVDYRVDCDHAIARACGVYATPQAVIIDAQGKLYFRGNYNQSRYCTSRATNFAELALVALLNNQPPPVFDITATQSYGCELEGENPYQLSYR